MKSSNPIAYINHLRGAGPSLRSQVDDVAEIQARIAALQVELSARVKYANDAVAQHWSKSEVDEAKSEVAL